MRDLLISLIVFASVPVTLVRPYVGLLVFYWLSLMNPHRLTWGFAQTLRVAIITALATIIAWLFSREPKHPPAVAPVLLLAAFAVWVTIGTFLAVNPVDAWEKWDWVSKMFLMTFLAMCLIQDRHRIHLLVWVVAVSIGFYGIRGGIFSIITGGNYRVYGPPDSFIADNNQLALALVMVIPLLWYLQEQTTSRFIRLGLWGAAGLTVIAIIGTYSRGGFLALGITLSALLWKAKRRMLTGLIMIGALAGVMAYKPDKWFERMQTIGEYQADQSAMGRFDAWEFAYKVALEKPLFGGGFRVFYDGDYFFRLVPNAAKVRNAHSIYFEVLGESGFVGLALFLMLGLSCLVICSKLIRKTRDHPNLTWAQRLAAMIQVSLIAYASAGAFLNLGFFDLYYVLIVLVVGLTVVVRKELAQETVALSAPTEGAPRMAQPSAA
jgi:putative inorganic carbon (hco3(-)) transporter